MILFRLQQLRLPGLCQLSLRTNLSSSYLSHEKYLKGESGGRRLDLSLKTGHELDFSHKSLSAADFTGAFLNTVIFHTPNFSKRFFGSILNNSSFVEADLTQADMRGAQMQGTNFTNAILNEAIWLTDRSFANSRWRPRTHSHNRRQIAPR